MREVRKTSLVVREILIGTEIRIVIVTRTEIIIEIITETTIETGITTEIEIVTADHVDTMTWFSGLINWNHDHVANLR